jgi:hypothetical protein
MPSDFPKSPKFLEGALVVYESQFIGSVQNSTVFQNETGSNLCIR